MTSGTGTGTGTGGSGEHGGSGGPREPGEPGEPGGVPSPGRVAGELGVALATAALRDIAGVTAVPPDGEPSDATHGQPADATHGEPPDATHGEPPDATHGEPPGTPDGEAPDAPDGEAPDAPDGERPDAPDERVAAAISTLDAALRGLPADDPYRLVVLYWRALTRATRFTRLGGNVEDCDAALRDFETLLGLPGCDETMADACHALMGMLRLDRSVPENLRRGERALSLRDFARLMASRAVHDPEDARLALGHLDRMTGPGAANPALAGVVSSLRAVARIAASGTRPAGEIPEELIAGLGALIEGEEGSDAEGLRGFRDALRAFQAVRDDRAEEAGTAFGALDRTLAGLGPGSAVGDVLRGMIGQYRDMTAKDHSTSQEATPEEREAALALLELVLEELPDDHPDRVPTLKRLIQTLLRTMWYRHAPERLGRIRELVLGAMARPAATPANDALNRLLLVFVDCFQSVLGEGVARPGDAIERIKRIVALVPADHEIRATGSALLSSVLALRYMRGGGLEHLDAAGYYARLRSGESGESGGSGSRLTDVTGDWLRAVTPLLRNPSSLDASAIDAVVGALRAVAGPLPEDHLLRPRIESDIHLAEFLRGAFGPDGPDPAGLLSDPGGVAATADSIEARGRELGRRSPYYSIEVGSAGFLRAHSGFARRDLRVLDEGITTLADAHDAAPVGLPFRPWLLGTLGQSLLMRYEVSGDRADLSNAILRLEEARRVQEADPFGNLTAMTLSTLATAYDTRDDARLDDRGRAAEAWLASLRVRAWGVLIQSDTGRAFEAAVAAAGEAADAAMRCVAGGMAGTAIEALEQGRAMVLHAAITDTTLPSLLREGGHHDLAAEWEAAPAESGPAPWDDPAGPAGYAGVLESLPTAPLPGDLRERVMAAIEGTETERRLFAVPSAGEVAAALREAGAAALAYLVVRDGGRGGSALVVGADGRTGEIPLPRLDTGPRSRVAAFQRAHRDHDMTEADTPGRRRAFLRWRHALGDLCDWAWEAAMEPLLGRTARGRLVLVPVGELGAVPWHAARREVGNGVRRYAVQDRVISYAASARQFVDARRHGRRPWAEDAALVRVGGSHLYWSSKEIEHIHGRHYPEGRLLGGRRSGAGRTGRGQASPRRAGPSPADVTGRAASCRAGLPATTENVVGLLPGPHSGGATLLHLGCHAHPARRPVDSHLLLAGGQTLGMTRILRQARARPPGVSGGLVVLAACGSDLTGRDHDEALTLATAFLAAGAVGVVGTRWPVDDLPTMLFTTMFHHYLNAGYDDPAVALRAAQLWMLDPRRARPAGLGEDLAGYVGEAPLHEPESWAAFTYQGR
ncbi:CHAT domain-containing protein [Streptosporangium sp. DT93]|uniref:CHAT domain-containing protein n=1 Tax=Streptosporangium sp. DT93 TaxID=3393428 RepID=UPI003CE794AF